MNTSGPLFLTKMFYEYGKIPKMKIISLEKFYGDCTICNVGNCKGCEYFSHEVGGSWHNFDSKIMDFLYCNYKEIITSILIGTGFIYVSI